MKKNFFAFFGVLFLVGILFAVSASAETEGSYTYTITNNEVTITDFDTTASGEITIPDTLGGYPVTNIGTQAFAYCSEITSVIIPEGVTTINTYAFFYCTSLTKITVPTSLTSILKYAFSGCNALTDVYYCDLESNYNISTATTGNSSFINAEAHYPEALISGLCGTNATYTLYDNGHLIISGNGAMTNYSSSRGVVWYEYAGTIKKITIGDGITSIGDSAFSDCTSLTNITIPGSVTSIGYSFRGCTSLTNVYITDIKAWCNITFKDEYSNPLRYAKNLYLNNELLTHLVIPEEITSIKNRTFRGCTSLTNITIPDSVTSIGSESFAACRGLKSIVIPDNVTSIGSQAFWACSNLTSINLPNRIASIKDGTFEGCKSLTNITIPDSVTSIGYGAFSGCTSLTSIVIPDNVKYIGMGSATYLGGAFKNCANLKNITIPNSVTSIGESTFDGCDNLTDVYYPGSKAQWSEITIGDNNEPLTTATIHYAYVNISYNANGGTGTFETQEFKSNENSTLTTSVPARTNYSFLGWATTADATEAEYQPGDTVSFDSDVTLYAVWELSNKFGVSVTTEPYFIPTEEYFDKDTEEAKEVTTETTAAVFAKNVHTDKTLKSGTYGINFGGTNFYGKADILPEKYWCIILVDQDGTVLLPGKIFEYYAFDGFGGKSDISEYIVE